MKNIKLTAVDKIRSKPQLISIVIILALLIVFPLTRKSTPTSVNVSSSHSLCSKVGESAQNLCWQSSLRDTYQKSGFSPSYRLFTDLYKADTGFRNNCHIFAHLVGQLAYQDFSGGKPLNVDSNISLCNYGFFHGFMETLGSHDGQLNQADSLCQVTIKHLSAIDPEVAEQCYHGIGHASSTTHDPSFALQVQARINQGLSVCENLPTSEEFKRFCFMGTFGSVFNQEEYNAPPQENRAQGLILCSQQLDRYQEGCLTSAIGHIKDFSQNYYAASLSFIFNMKIIDGANRSMILLSNRHIGEAPAKTDYQNEISNCRHFTDHWQSSCIIGLMLGIKKVQKDHSLGDLLSQFCNSKLLTEQEKTTCRRFATQ